MEVCPMSSSYSSEFKQDAAKLAVESDQSVAQTARDLGVNPNTLYTWITKYQQPDSPTAIKGSGGSGDKHPYEELKRLRRENAQLKEERDILKKAAAYFAKNSR
jgi:transposase